MRCLNCGTVVAEPDAAFCPECGRRLRDVSAAPPVISPSKRHRQRTATAPHHYGWVIAVVSVLAVLVISLIAFTVYFGLSAEDWSDLLGRKDGEPASMPALRDTTAEDGDLPARAPTAAAEEPPEPTLPPETDEAAAAPPPAPEENGQEDGEQQPAAAGTVEPEPVLTVTLPGGTQAPASDFIFPYSATQALTTADLDAAFAGLDGATAALLSQQAINEIYARYGYRFHPELSDSAQWASQYFGALSWYSSIVHDRWSSTGAVPINSTESANIDLIVEWQRSHGYR